MLNTLLIDGSYLLLKSVSVKNGNPYYIFLNLIRKIIKDVPKINKCVVVFDGNNSGKKRYLLYKDYKGNRKNKNFFNKDDNNYENNIIKNNLLEILKNLYIRTIEINEVEGDDVISEYVIQKHKYENIHIYTNDVDYLILLKYGITLFFNEFKTKYYDEYDKIQYKFTHITKNNSHKYFKYHYTNNTNIKILTGDDSDNIKGIYRISVDKIIKNIPQTKNRFLSINKILERLYNHENTTNLEKFLIHYFITKENYDILNKINIKKEENGKYYSIINKKKYFYKKIGKNNEKLNNKTLTIINYIKSYDFNYIKQDLDYIIINLLRIDKNKIINIYEKIINLNKPLLNTNNKKYLNNKINENIEYVDKKGNLLIGSKNIIGKFNELNILKDYNFNGNKFNNYLKCFINITKNERKNGKNIKI